MKFSMNGFRQQLSRDTAALRDLVNDVVNGDHHEEVELIEAMNNLITHSNVINCVYQDDDPMFTDMSEVEIEHIESELLDA